MADSSECILLLDNGSLRAEATLQLRALAKVLGEKLEKRVHPVSLLHSSKVDPEQLDGRRANTFAPFLRSQCELGISKFIVLPLFFGPSGALVDYLPSRVNDLVAEGWDDLEVILAPTLVREGDARVAQIMAELVRKQISEAGWAQPAVAMCDHGTPAIAVNEVRNLVASQLAGILSAEVRVVRACSMERREGAQYDFNQPLLEDLLGQEGFDQEVIVSMLFVGPGRHAGAEGDVAQICTKAKEVNAQLEVEMTDLVGSGSESLIDILADRFHQI